MTDKHAGYLIVLDQDIREDDAEAIINAIKMIKHVSTVTPVVANPTMYIAQNRADDVWRERLLTLLQEPK
jgi:hypothetical protein